VVDQFGDVSLGGAPLGWFQGQHELPAEIEPAIVDLTNVITVLQPHRVFELAFAAGQGGAIVNR
jgi:hypothetical protein